MSRNPKKRVIVAGGGITGLSAAYELTQRGCEVTVLEALGRSGGHILTASDLPDGLYADAGAEHFYQHGYNLLWSYIEKFRLPLIPYPRREKLWESVNGKLYSEDQLRDPARLKGFGFNEPEIKFLSHNYWSTLAAGLYYAPFIEKFKDEYQPLGIGLDHLDRISTREFLLELGASEIAAGLHGLDRLTGPGQSALQAVWHAVIRAKRGMALLETKLFRLRGGNQQITDAFAAQLGSRIKLGCPVTAIEHEPGGVRVRYQENGRAEMIEGDHLVVSLPLSLLRKIPVTPDWPAAKRYVVDNLAYDSHSRVIFQSKTRFWEKDGISPNMNLGETSLNMVWATSEEVKTPRGLLLGTISTGTRAEDCTPEKALAAFRRRYPGKSEDIEHCRVIRWAADPGTTTCLPLPLPPGELPKYWPEVLRSCGRVHFAGVYADNLPFGLEGGIRSAQRVAKEIEPG